MARPQKYTVDYFPHLCKQGKTIYILEARYGNDGYAFWFKLLEILATTDGHYFIAEDNVQWEFLGAKTRFPTDKMGDILGLLAGIEAIDKDLWEKHKVIWCQNLINNVAEVYENRKGLMPEKPYYQDGILHQNIDNHNINLITSTHNTQSKLKESKLKESKVVGKAPTTTFEEYKKELKEEFTGIDFEGELKKFDLWWGEGKKPLKRPKLALRNWLIKAREFKQDGKAGQSTTREERAKILKDSVGKPLR